MASELYCLMLGLIMCSLPAAYGLELLLMTVASERTDGFNRYIRSATSNKLNGKVLGMDEEWKGGDMTGQGGAYKMRLLKEELENYKDRDDLVIMFTDSYDVILLANETEILSKFKKLDANIVFGAEKFCWPDKDLEKQYPLVATSKESPFLNSGGFIGTAKDIYDILQSFKGQDSDDDQLYYSKVFLDEKLRDKHQIKLDTKSEIFQNLNGAVGEVKLSFRKHDGGSIPYLQNIASNTKPLVIHGNGPTKILTNTLGNYLPDSWNDVDHCTECWEDTVAFQDLEQVPTVVLAIFIEEPTPFISEFFDKIVDLDYPKDRLNLFIHNKDSFHTKDVKDFLNFYCGDKGSTDQDGCTKYASVRLIEADEKVAEWTARNSGIDHCYELDCDFYFAVDSSAHLDNPQTLKLLIEQNRKVVAPMLMKPYKAWSNFWGALSDKGYYARSMDYMDIIDGTRRGLWNVPFITSAYLISGELIRTTKKEMNSKVLSFGSGLSDPDMAFCANLRDAEIFMHVSNRMFWGHLVEKDGFPTSHLHNELWEIERNRWDWEQRYIHENYSTQLKKETPLLEPCPDVFWFPVVTELFTDHFVAEMEHYGQWSDGSHQDTRLDGGYENVPTRDIHMRQVGFHDEWLTFLDVYVRPLQEKAFYGYKESPPRSTMNFIVRYRPDEQPSLRPHFDSSTYTINVALNHAGIDFQGGGCRFIRQNCSILTTRKGWLLMHPGRLTHFHEGLTTTSGTRYIMVSFVDP